MTTVESKAIIVGDGAIGKVRSRSISLFALTSARVARGLILSFSQTCLLSRITNNAIDWGEDGESAPCESPPPSRRTALDGPPERVPDLS